MGGLKKADPVRKIHKDIKGVFGSAKGPAMQKTKPAAALGNGAGSRVIRDDEDEKPTNKRRFSA